MSKLRELGMALIEKCNAWWDLAIISGAILILLIVSTLEAAGRMNADEEDGPLT